MKGEERRGEIRGEDRGCWEKLREGRVKIGDETKEETRR
jgi:hypothetical protein